MEQKKIGFEGQKAIWLPNKFIAKFCEQNPLIKTAYLTAIGYYPNAKFHYYEKVSGIDHHILIYNKEGHGWTEIDQQKYFINPGDFFIVPAGSSYRYAADEKKPWTIYWIHFKGINADAFVNAHLQKNGSPKSFVAYNEERLIIFEKIYKNLEKGYGHDNISFINMSLIGYLSSFLFGDNFDVGSSGEQTQDMVNLSIEFMQKNIDKTLELKTIASFVNISASHYSYTFKRKTGFSPIEYFTHLKIQKACQYLQFTNLRIKEIAVEVGVDNSYYFSRLFTKVMGVSPKKYRIKHSDQP